MNKTLGIILVVLVIIVGAILITSGNNGSLNDRPLAGEGKVIFSLTDATADMQAVSEVKLQINNVEIYNQTKGWTRIQTTGDEYALLELRNSGKAELLASANVDADTYDQIRFSINRVEVEKTDGSVETAVVIGSDLVVNSTTVVRDQESTNVEIDIFADKSLHTATDGSYVFAPNFQVKSTSGAEVTVASDMSVQVSGGTVDSSIQAGTDIDGSVKANFELPTDVSLEIDIFGNVESETGASGDNQGEAGANIDGSMETNTSDGDQESDDSNSVEVDTSLEGSLY